MQDATSLAAAIASGQTTASTVMEAALQRAAELTHLGLLARLEPELGRAGALVAAPGPFQGVPFLGKDLGTGAAGMTPRAGSAALRQRMRDNDHDDALFARFRAGGLVPFGLTTVPEFGFALTSDPARNPWNPGLTPGGSSGGAAGAVAAGIVAIAHATDAAGSTRVPAACCGLVGLKSSRGAMPGGAFFGNHLMGIASELVLARSVRDVATAFELMNGFGDAPPAPVHFSDKPLIGLAISAGCGPAQARAARDAAGALDGVVRTIEPPDALGARALALARIILSVSLSEWLDSFGIGLQDVRPIAAALASEGRLTPAKTLFVASRDMAQLAEQTRHLFDTVDIILSPVLSGPPPPLGHFDMAGTDVTAHLARMSAMAPNAALANVTGFPALVLPFGMEGGLPIGVQLMGPLGSDRALLAHGKRLQEMAPKLTYPYPIAGHP